MMVLTSERVKKLKGVLKEQLLSIGVSLAILIDEAGNVIASSGKENGVDTTSLAALAAANFGATAQIAKLLGEEDFSILYHKGKKDNIHFSRIGKEFILVTIFTDETPLGLVRLRVNQISQDLLNLLVEDD
ncbi:roadblock/LC7 domain-containing protein [Thermodesulfatator autotrophicus]|uniref:Dynein regulation protein LC7 n=1 Tax=Thermodesulfatator autotrophicus TaxID=1795632 RepID=A0A177E8P2_9BACT|nr:roadblock/LC7 domain-containing protein [Thermodesulfatator autotrophicus]OAG27582.1 dynein regulation protein LC7 [Thermodesulfatator autotrophicus]